MDNWYIDEPMIEAFVYETSKIVEETGEPPYLEKAIVWFAFLFGPIALALSIVVGFLAFSWWGIICLVLCPIVYFAYSSSSVMGGSKLIGIAGLVLISVCVHFFGNLKAPWLARFASAFLLSLWCVRLLYCSSTVFFRAFVIRNGRAFEYLSDYLVIRHVDSDTG